MTNLSPTLKAVSAPEQTLSAANVLQSWDGDVFRLMGDRIPYPKDTMDMPSPQKT